MSNNLPLPLLHYLHISRKNCHSLSLSLWLVFKTSVCLGWEGFCWYKSSNSLVCWFAGHLGLSVCWVYDRMGTDGKPAADQGHDVSSCETTVVFPVHKVLSVTPLFVYCETFNVISFFFFFLFEQQCYLILCAPSSVQIFG